MRPCLPGLDSLSPASPPAAALPLPFLPRRAESSDVDTPPLRNVGTVTLFLTAYLLCTQMGVLPFAGRQDGGARRLFSAITNIQTNRSCSSSRTSPLCAALPCHRWCNRMQPEQRSDRPRVNLGIHTIHTIHLLTACLSSKPLALVHLPASHIHSLSDPRPEARVLCSTLTERAAKNRRLSLVRLGLAWV